ncbi:hypothetical protein VTL71DRAFT_2910 [Oculimacula yallundae]|uniref:Uncharacterized protein n=1 Tax=Oculimacula yallundae TaxID=86028 RepID=A0ABR4C6T1_9HELO
MISRQLNLNAAIDDGALINCLSRNSIAFDNDQQCANSRMTITLFTTSSLRVIGERLPSTVHTFHTFHRIKFLKQKAYSTHDFPFNLPYNTFHPFHGISYLRLHTSFQNIQQNLKTPKWN